MTPPNPRSTKNGATATRSSSSRTMTTRRRASACATCSNHGSSHAGAAYGMSAPRARSSHRSSKGDKDPRSWTRRARSIWWRRVGSCIIRADGASRKVCPPDAPVRRPDDERDPRWRCVPSRRRISPPSPDCSSVRSGADPPAPWLASYLRRVYLEHPWAEDEIPSLVMVDDGRVVGFLGSHVRRGVVDGRPVRVAVPGQLAIDRDARGGAAAGLLLRRYLAGPQDLSITESSNAAVERMWHAAGGGSLPLQRIGWLRMFAPVRSAIDLLAERSSRIRWARDTMRRVSGLETRVGRTRGRMPRG